MTTIIELIDNSFPITVTSGDDFLNQFKQNLKNNIPFTLGVNKIIRDAQIESLIAFSSTKWNEGVSKGLTIEENLLFVKNEISLISDEITKQFGPTVTLIESFEEPDLHDFLGDIVEALPDIPNPFAWIEWLQKNWLLIVIAITIAIIIIIIVFSIMVTGPLMEAVMIGALS